MFITSQDFFAGYWSVSVFGQTVRVRAPARRHTVPGNAHQSLRTHHVYVVTVVATQFGSVVVNVDLLRATF